MAAAVDAHWYKHNQILLDVLEPGDMIQFPRGAYSHWAVYIGKEEVVHLSGEDDDGINGRFDSGHFLTISGHRFNKALVKIDKFWDVAEGSKAFKNNSKDKKLEPLTPQEIIKNALSKLGQIGYNVLFDNCEHFASWCRYGKSKSDQVDSFLTGLALGTAVLTTAGLLYGLSRSTSESEKKKKHKHEN